MDLKPVPQKNINELEQMTTQLLKTMRSAKIHDLPVYIALQEFEQQIGKERQSRFDDSNSLYQGY